jgi:hypothetical protein
MSSRDIFQIGMGLANVCLDLLDELVVALGAHLLATFTVDDSRHLGLLSVG